MKEIIRAILRTATFITTFFVLFSVVGFSYSYIETEATLKQTLFWSIACLLTAIKIAYINEDF